MARSRRPPEERPAEQPAAGLEPAVAAALAAAQAGGLTLPAGAAGAGTALTAKQIAEVSSAVIAALLKFARELSGESSEFLLVTLTRQYPERTREAIERIVREEMVREREFIRKMRERIERDVPEALGIADPEERRLRLEAILNREKRYLQMRREAMVERAAAALEMDALRETSPKGAYWRLSPYVREHTLDCIAMGEKFWPWPVLIAAHPPMHVGCRCQLLSLDEAVRLGYMLADQVPDPKDAARRARKLLSDARRLMEEGLTREEIAEAVDERLHELEEVRRGAPSLGGARFYGSRIGERFMKGLTKGGEFKPRRGGVSAPSGARFLGARGRGRGIKLPEVVDMKTPARKRADGDGRWANLGGREVFVPEGRKFDREIGGRRYTSPPGSTSVYRDGKDYDTPDVTPSGKQRLAGPEELEGIPADRDGTPLKVGATVGWGDDPKDPTKRGIVGGFTEYGSATLIRKDEKTGTWRRVLIPPEDVRLLGDSKADANAPKARAIAARLDNESRDNERQRLEDDPTLAAEPPTTEKEAWEKTFEAPGGGMKERLALLGQTKQELIDDLKASPSYGWMWKGKQRMPEDKQKAVDRLTAMMKARREREPHGLALNALEALDADRPPAKIGAAGEGTDQALRKAGFHETGLEERPETITFHYTHPDTGSNLSVEYSDADDAVVDFEWTPQAYAPPEARRATEVPDSFEGFAAELTGYAKELGEKSGNDVLLTEVRYTPGEFDDHAGQHNWDGTLHLGADVPGDIEALRKRIEAGEVPTASESQGAWAAYRVGYHEALHAENPMTQEEYVIPEYHALEESIVEEISQADVAEALTKQGAAAVVAWASANHRHHDVEGTYRYNRLALDEVMTRAGIPVEERLDRMRELKHGSRPGAARLRRLAEMVADRDQTDGGPLADVDDAEHWVRTTMAASEMHRDQSEFAPVSIPQAPGGAGAFVPPPVTHLGAELRPGTRITVQRRTGPNRDILTTTEAEVIQTTDAPEYERGFVATVMFPEQRTVGWVTPEDIIDVSGAPAGSEQRLLVRRTDEAGTQYADVPIMQGDRIRYDNVKGGETREARVLRILRTENRAGTDPRTGWQLEVTTAGGERVVLTQERAGWIERADVAVPTAPGGARAEPRERELPGELGLPAAVGAGKQSPPMGERIGPHDLNVGDKFIDSSGEVYEVQEVRPRRRGGTELVLAKGDGPFAGMPTGKVRYSRNEEPQWFRYDIRAAEERRRNAEQFGLEDAGVAQPGGKSRPSGWHGATRGAVTGGGFRGPTVYLAHERELAQAYAEGEPVYEVQDLTVNPLVLDTPQKFAEAWERSGAGAVPGNFHPNKTEAFAQWARGEGHDAVQIPASAFSQDTGDEAADFEAYDRGPAGLFGEPQTLVLDPRLARIKATGKARGGEGMEGFGMLRPEPAPRRRGLAGVRQRRRERAKERVRAALEAEEPQRGFGYDRVPRGKARPSGMEGLGMLDPSFSPSGADRVADSRIEAIDYVRSTRRGRLAEKAYEKVVGGKPSVDWYVNRAKGRRAKGAPDPEAARQAEFERRIADEEWEVRDTLARMGQQRPATVYPWEEPPAPFGEVVRDLPRFGFVYEGGQVWRSGGTTIRGPVGEERDWTVTGPTGKVLARAATEGELMDAVAAGRFGRRPGGLEAVRRRRAARAGAAAFPRRPVEGGGPARITWGDDRALALAGKARPGPEFYDFTEADYDRIDAAMDATPEWDDAPYGERIADEGIEVKIPLRARRHMPGLKGITVHPSDPQTEAETGYPWNVATFEWDDGTKTTQSYEQWHDLDNVLKDAAQEATQRKIAGGGKARPAGGLEVGDPVEVTLAQGRKTTGRIVAPEAGDADNVIAVEVEPGKRTLVNRARVTSLSGKARPAADLLPELGEIHSMHAYARRGHVFNERLRQGLPLEPEQERMYERLDGLLERGAEDKPITRYRAISDIGFMAARPEDAVGRTIVDPAPLSTTSDEGYAQKWTAAPFVNGKAVEEGYVLRMTVEAGVPSADLGDFGLPWESETILGRGLHQEITGYDAATRTFDVTVRRGAAPGATPLGKARPSGGEVRPSKGYDSGFSADMERRQPFVEEAGWPGLTETDLAAGYEDGGLAVLPLIKSITRDFPEVENFEVEVLDRASWDPEWTEPPHLYVFGLRVRADARGEGAGTKALRRALDFADRRGLEVRLSPDPDETPEGLPGDVDRLKAWYGRFGFVDGEDEWADHMIRQPLAPDDLSAGKGSGPAWIDELPLGERVLVRLASLPQHPSVDRDTRRSIEGIRQKYGMPTPAAEVEAREVEAGLGAVRARRRGRGPQAAGIYGYEEPILGRPPTGKARPAPEDMTTGPGGEELWTGWRKLKPGDRVRSTAGPTGTVKSVRTPDKHKGGTAGVTVDWDNGAQGRVTQPAALLRPETPEGGKARPAGAEELVPNLGRRSVPELREMEREAEGEWDHASDIDSWMPDAFGAAPGDDDYLSTDEAEERAAYAEEQWLGRLEEVRAELGKRGLEPEGFSAGMFQRSYGANYGKERPFGGGLAGIRRRRRGERVEVETPFDSEFARQKAEAYLGDIDKEMADAVTREVAKGRRGEMLRRKRVAEMESGARVFGSSANEPGTFTGRRDYDERGPIVEVELDSGEKVWETEATLEVEGRADAAQFGLPGKARPTIAPALPEEVENAEAAYNAKAREIGPLWGEDDEVELDALGDAVQKAYDDAKVPNSERMAGWESDSGITGKASPEAGIVGGGLAQFGEVPVPGQPNPYYQRLSKKRLKKLSGVKDKRRRDWAELEIARRKGGTEARQDTGPLFPHELAVAGQARPFAGGLAAIRARRRRAGAIPEVEHRRFEADLTGYEQMHRERMEMERLEYEDALARVEGKARPAAALGYGGLGGADYQKRNLVVGGFIGTKGPAGVVDRQREYDRYDREVKEPLSEPYTARHMSSSESSSFYSQMAITERGRQTFPERLRDNEIEVTGEGMTRHAEVQNFEGRERFLRLVAEAEGKDVEEIRGEFAWTETDKGGMAVYSKRGGSDVADRAFVEAEAYIAPPSPFAQAQGGMFGQALAGKARPAPGKIEGTREVMATRLDAMPEGTVIQAPALPGEWRKTGGEWVNVDDPARTLPPSEFAGQGTLKVNGVRRADLGGAPGAAGMGRMRPAAAQGTLWGGVTSRADEVDAFTFEGERFEVLDRVGEMVDVRGSDGRLLQVPADMEVTPDRAAPEVPEGGLAAIRARRAEALAERDPGTLASGTPPPGFAPPGSLTGKASPSFWKPWGSSKGDPQAFDDPEDIDDDEDLPSWWSQALKGPASPKPKTLKPKKERVFEGPPGEPKKAKENTDDSGRLTHLKGAGGTNGAQWFTDENDDRWLVKTYQGNVDRVATELLANGIYRRMGAKVALAGQIGVKGKPALGYRSLDGEVKPYVFKNGKPSKKLGDHFMTDALVANWDFAGLEDDNILWDSKDNPFRVDQGGTFEFRAQGQNKDYGAVPAEVWTLMSPQGQATRASQVSATDKMKQAADIEKTLTPEVIDAEIDKVPFDDVEMRERVREALKARVAWMGRYSRGEELEPDTLSGEGAAAAMTDGQAGLELRPEQADALERFGAEGPTLNQTLRGGPGAPPAAPEAVFEDEPVDMQVGDVPFTEIEDEPDWAAIPHVEVGEPELPGKKPREGKPGEPGKKPMKSFGKAQSAGVVIEEDDGRVWVVEPDGHFGGYERTFPKGRVEEGLTLQQTALKELFEETGMTGEITGYIGDAEGTTTMTRYYRAKRTGGNPWSSHWETASVRLVDPVEVWPKLQARDAIVATEAGNAPAGIEEFEATRKSLDSILGHVRTEEDMTAWTATAEGLLEPGKTFAEAGYMTPSFDKPTDLPEQAALVRVHIPAGSKALHPAGVPELAEDWQGADIILRRGQRYRVIGRREVNGREVLEIVLLPD